jgi:hypothetical protein
MRTDSLTRDVREKTLEAWVLLGNLDQRGGGVISIEYPPTFDAIAFGELVHGGLEIGNDCLRLRYE